MNENLKQEAWSKNVILVDTDYLDRVAFDLIVNFERMLERHIPQADLARWIDCVALDGGMRPDSDGQEATSRKQKNTQVILLYSKKKAQFDNFVPSNFRKELDGKAFCDQLGEFCFSCIPVEELTSMEDLFCESLQHICQQTEIKRLMVVGDDQYYNKVLNTLKAGDTLHTDGTGGRFTTVFSMQPTPACLFRQEILGYSLMAALGIKGEEITNKNK